MALTGNVLRDWMAHSIIGRSAWESTAWRAVLGAAWAAVRGHDAQPVRE
jgi:hypothetical protein